MRSVRSCEVVQQCIYTLQSWYIYYEMRNKIEKNIIKMENRREQTTGVDS